MLRRTAAEKRVTPEVLQQLRRRYLSGMVAAMPAGARGAGWLVDKFLGNSWSVGHIGAVVPEACLLHASRHPADSALSAFQQSFYPDKVNWSVVSAVGGWGGGGGRGVLAAVGGAGEVV